MLWVLMSTHVFVQKNNVNTPLIWSYDVWTVKVQTSNKYSSLNMSSTLNPTEKTKAVHFTIFTSAIAPHNTHNIRFRGRIRKKYFLRFK